MVKTSLGILTLAALIPVSAHAQLPCDLESGDAANWRVGKVVAQPDFDTGVINIEPGANTIVRDPGDEEILSAATRAWLTGVDFLYCVNSTGGPPRIQKAAAATAE